MISWIQNMLERKGRIVFIILLAVVVVAFVFVIGETPGCVSGAPGTQARDYYGYNLNSEREMNALAQEVIISSVVTRGQRPRTNEQMNQEMLSRVALLHLADVANVPQPSQQSLLLFLSEIPFFQNEQGEFDPNRLTNFMDMTQLSQQFDQQAIDRTMNNDFRISQLMTSLTAPGFTMPYDVEEQVRRMDASYDLVTARLPQDRVEFTFDPSEEEIATFFSQRVEAYRVPETRTLAQVSFTPASFTDQVEEPTEEEIQTFFDNNRTRYLNEDAEDPARALPRLEEVRSEVIADLKEEEAETLARRNAEEFVYTLFDEQIGMGEPRVDDLVAAHGGLLVTLEPMIGTAPPANSDLPAEAWTEAARLDSLRYFSDPFETEGSVEVLLLREVQPSYIPELSEVREAVLADLEEQQKQEALVTFGAEIREQLSSAVADGTPFAEAAANLGLEVRSYESVSWENLPDGLDNGVLQRAETLPDREVSAMTVTETGGSFLFVESRGAPRFPPDSEQYQETRQFLASGNARRFVSSFLSDLIQSGLAQANVSQTP